MATVNIFGDCVSQMICEDIQHIRAIGLTSILSVMSRPLENAVLIDEDMSSGWDFSDYRKRCILKDIKKKALQYLLEEKADYIVVDCCDCRMSVVGQVDMPEKTSVEEVSCVTGRTLMRSAYDQIYSVLSMNEELREWAPNDLKPELYVSAVRKFCDEIKKVYSCNHVIINMHYFADEYIEEDSIYPYSRHGGDIREKWETVGLLKKLFDVMISEFEGCYIIGFPNRTLGQNPHRLGLFPLHYHTYYYEYGKECMDAICKKGGINQQLLDEKRTRYEMLFSQIKRDICVRNHLDRIERFNNTRNRWLVALIKNNEKEIVEELRNVVDIELYLEGLKLIVSEVIVLMGVRDTVGIKMHKEVFDRICNLGFRSFDRSYGIMYAGIACCGDIIADDAGSQKKEAVVVSRAYEGHSFRIESHAYLPMRNVCQIVIDGCDYSLNKRGINMVIYDPYNNVVVDSIAYDSHTEIGYLYRGSNIYKTVL